MKGGGVNSPD